MEEWAHMLQYAKLQQTRRSVIPLSTSAEAAPLAELRYWNNRFDALKTLANQVRDRTGATLARSIAAACRADALPHWVVACVFPRRANRSSKATVKSNEFEPWRSLSAVMT